MQPEIFNASAWSERPINGLRRFKSTILELDTYFTASTHIHCAPFLNTYPVPFSFFPACHSKYRQLPFPTHQVTPLI